MKISKKLIAKEVKNTKNIKGGGNGCGTRKVPLGLTQQSAQIELL